MKKYIKTILFLFSPMHKNCILNVLFIIYILLLFIFIFIFTFFIALLLSIAWFYNLISILYLKSYYWIFFCSNCTISFLVFIQLSISYLHIWNYIWFVAWSWPSQLVFILFFFPKTFTIFKFFLAIKNYSHLELSERRFSITNIAI